MGKPTGWIVLLSFLASVGSASADALDDVRKQGFLIWGADAEGGGPFVFPDEKDPNRLLGFEVELADMIAAEIGVKAKMQQGQWQNIPAMLESGKIHVALNGFESTPVFARDYLMCRPYFAYGLQLMARTDAPFHTWEELRKVGSQKLVRIGVLSGSAAETFVKTKYSDVAEIRSYEGNTEPMAGAESGQVDASLQDDCVAVFYADRFSKLRFIERPVGGSFYVPLVKKGETKLEQAINAAVEKLLKDGSLERLYDRWKLSGRYQALALRSADAIPPAPRQSFADLMRANIGVLLSAAGMTVLLSFASMPLAILFGILIALGRSYGPRPLAWLFALYVEVIRGTPLMLQLYAIFFLLPQLGLPVPALVAAIAGLAINYSAYEAEIYRAGLQAVPRGQMEAALALGMTRSQAIRRIILPQAVRIVIPPVTNDFIALFKDTSVCSVVTVVELTKQYNVLAQSTGAIVELAAVTALLYMMMSYPLSLAAAWSERRLGKSAAKVH